MTSADRFDRQRRFAGLGDEGQARLEDSSVLLVGCGALGGVLAQELARMGVGRLRLADRDVVELTNLPRQVLFDEGHAERGLPKVEAARETLARVGGPTRVEPHAVHVGADNLDALAGDVDLVLDGTDNLATRYLVNDWCVANERPWVYGGVVGGAGLVLAVRPGAGACLRCVFPQPPPPGSLPTCDTAGVIVPAVAAVASLQVGLATRILTDRGEVPPSALLSIDVWEGDVQRIAAPRDPKCPCCGERQFPFLEDGEREPVVLCGRNTVQVQGPRGGPDLDALAVRLADSRVEVERVGPVLRFGAEDCRLTVFPDGRALVEGTEDPDRARVLYDRFVGS